MNLLDALTQAKAYWATRKGWRVMECRASVCVSLVGPQRSIKSLTAPDGTKLLTALSRRGLSLKSQADYYQTFKRLLTLNGVQTHAWPKAPEPPRRSRDSLTGSDYERLRDGLKDHPGTADLLVLLHGCGLRIGIEALAMGRFEFHATGQSDYGILTIRGKGDHERTIPVERHSGAYSILCDRGRIGAIQSEPYRTHLRRWHKASRGLGIKSRLATPHSLRHNYATRVLKASGGNLRLVQELLGHASPATTARYAQVDMADKVAALVKASAAVAAFPNLSQMETP